MDYLTFPDVLRRAAWRRPDQTFIYWSDRRRSITYSDGERASDAVAGGLAELGVRKGDRVAILAHNGLDYVLAMFGIWKLGAVSAHINVQQVHNLAWFVNDAGPRILIYTGDLHDAVMHHLPHMPSLEHLICFDGARPSAHDWNALLATDLKPPAVILSADDAAHLSYTSGSSGKPKGAVLAHGYTARATHCIAERLQLSPADVSLGPTSLASSYHLVANLLPAMHRCAQVGVRKQWDAAAVVAEIAERGVTFIAANPLLLADLLNHIRQTGSRPATLRFVMCGGASAPLELKRAYRDELGIPLVEAYGQSELGGFVAMGYPRLEDDAHLSAIGPELPDREVRIADQDDRPVAVGLPGEILIRGGVMLGYHNLPEKTREVLRNGWLHTGDVGIMDADGYITLLGRLSERIVMNGRAVFPRPLEEALLRYPAVRYVCVVGAPHPQSGRVPRAFVELFPGASATPDELLAHCQDLLGAQNTLREVEILAQMPMTPTGKIARADLQACVDSAGAER